MATQAFPNLSKYLMNTEQRDQLQANFDLVLQDARLIDRTKPEVCGVIDAEYDRVYGVYFWVMSVGSDLYSVYVGKTHRLKDRVGDYFGAFQPHCTNDYKIRIFQNAVLSLEQTARFQLYFRKSSETDYTNLETQLDRQYKPLLNSRTKLPESVRETLRMAFEVYYRTKFEAMLSQSLV